jgi:oxalate decarboxylase
METERRQFLGGLAFGVSAIATSRALGAEGDGHAAGEDVTKASTYGRTIPRKSGTGTVFTASLDAGPIKATSGGWARDLTANQLPIATAIAGAHLFLNPGGIREMHWHTSAKWAYIIAGQCQATIIDPEGEIEVVSYGPGDLWTFPAGHAHAIQCIGSVPCHAILTFDDGLYGDHGTYGLTDWLARVDGGQLKSKLGLSEAVTRELPQGETYIMQGPVLSAESAAKGEKRLKTMSSHRFGLSDIKPHIESDAGTLRAAPASAFSISTTMTDFIETLQPGAVHTPHWHPLANEWHFLVRGRTRVTLFEPEKRLAVAEMKPGGCAYFPRAAAHMIENIGAEPCEFVGVHDKPNFQECSLSQWLANAPHQVIAANLGVRESELASLPPKPITFTKST